MNTTTYALATIDEATAREATARGSVSASPSCIQVGDLISRGPASYAEVIDITVTYTNGCIYFYTLAGGEHFTATPDGFWSQIVRIDAEAHAAAASTARAFASAYDRKR